MAAIGIDKVKHSDFISFLFQKIACVSQDFALGVKHYKRGVGLHNVRFGIEACFTCTRAADNHDVQIAPMLFSVKTYPCVLCQKNIMRPILIRIFSGENCRCTPFCRAIFFSLSVVMLSRKVYADRNAIYQKKNQNCLWWILTPLNGKWIVHAFCEAVKDTHQTFWKKRGDHQGRPYHWNNSENKENVQWPTILVRFAHFQLSPCQRLFSLRFQYIATSIIAPFLFLVCVFLA